MSNETYWGELSLKDQVSIITHYIKYLSKFVIVLILFFFNVRIFMLDILSIQRTLTFFNLSVSIDISFIIINTVS